ncbi:MAG: TolC family protein [Magnetococcus sp. DMHC-1]|nr:TolC family protein [Magnetococcales bacterium]
MNWSLQGQRIVAVTWVGWLLLCGAGELLTLEKSLEIAFRENLNLDAQTEGQKNKEALAKAAFKNMLPKLSLGTSRTDILHNTARSGSLAETYNTTLNVSQTLYSGGALQGSWKKSLLETRQAELNLLNEKRSLVQRVKAAWYTLLETTALHKEAVAALERLKQHEQNAQAFYREGRFWRNEVLQAQVEVARGEQRLIEADNALQLAKSGLNRLLQRPLDAPVDFTGTLEWQEIPVTLEEAFAQAKANRADLESARLGLETGQLSETITKAALLPSVSLRATHNLDADDVHYNPNDSRESVTLNVNWDFWEWGRTSQLVEAQRAANRQTDLKFRELIETILLEVKQVYLNTQGAAKRVQVLKQSLDQAEENYRVNQVRYREQLGTATDVLNAMDLLTSTRNSYTSAQAGYLTSLATLDRATGNPVLP